MGIRGLTSLVNTYSRVLYKDFCLQDTKIVIDGFGLVYYLLDAELQSEIRDFFQCLLKCNCTPYVVFDGCFDLDGKKHDTMVNRLRDSISSIKDAFDGEDIVFLSPLDIYIVKQVLTEMNIGFAISEFEGDKEIAMLANHWQCPVVGEDSDFMVMDIVGGYLPLSLLKWPVVQKSKGKFYIRSRIYQVNNFCNFFRVKKESLPLFATLAGNDYINPDSLDPFLSSEVYGKYDSTGSKRQKKLKDLLCWLSEHRSFTNILKDVLKCFPNEDLEPCLQASIGMYQTRDDSSNLVSYLGKQRHPRDFQAKSQLCTAVGIPVWVAAAHQEGSIDSLLINIRSMGYCFSAVQLEDLRRPSVWLPSEALFSVMSGIALADRRQGNEGASECHVYIRDGGGLKRKKVSPLDLLEGYGELPTLAAIPSLHETDKQKLLLQALAPNLTSHMELLTFPAAFQLAILVMLYWMNSEHSHYNEFHINSLLVGWVYLYTQRQNRMCKDGGPSELQGQCAASAPSRDLKSECKIMYTNFSHSLRRLRKRKPDPVISQSFSQWQQCLYYGICFNELLQSPLPDCRDASILFNGLLMHNLYMTLWYDSVPPNRYAVVMFFKDTPIASQLFVSMHKFITSNARKVGQKMSASDGQQSKQSSRKSKPGQGQQQKGIQQQGATPKSSNQATEDIDSDRDWGSNKRFALLHI
ncbi:protein asteroid homolog 1-like [Lytechinus pictus]|uniref:protein asteroid homolog 1-like n=1 Tax=Lytechinus pictus TaxID=7653 RepID=UPI0030B9FEC2